MILAAENDQCDVINNYMADIQHGEQIVYEAKYFNGSRQIK